MLNEILGQPGCGNCGGTLQLQTESAAMRSSRLRRWQCAACAAGETRQGLATQPPRRQLLRDCSSQETSLELPLFLPAEIATDKPARRYRCPQESCNYDLCSSCIFRGQERVPSQTVSLTAKSKARASRASKASRASPRARPVTAGRSGWAEPADPGPATREPRRQEQQQVAGHVTKKRKKCGRQTHSLSSAVATAH